MKNRLRTIPGKAILFILTSFLMTITIVAIAMAIGMYETGLYSVSDFDEIVKQETYIVSERMAYNIMAEQFDISTSLNMEKPGNFYYTITDVQGNKVFGNAADGKEYDYTGYFAINQATHDIYGSDELMSRKEEIDEEDFIDEYSEELEENEISGQEQSTMQKVQLGDEEVYLYEGEKLYCFEGYYEGGVPDTYYDTLKYQIEKIAYQMRYAVYPIGIVSGIFTFFSLIALMSVAARRPHSEELYPGYCNHVPFDLLVLILGICPVTGCWVGLSQMGNENVLFSVMAACGVGMLFLSTVVVGLLFSAAARIKQRTLLRNTVIWAVGSFFWKFVRRVWTFLGKFVCRVWTFFRKMWQELKGMMLGISLVWRSLVIFVLFSAFDLVVMAMCCYSVADGYFAFWLIWHVILFVLLWKVTLSLRILQKGGRALAKGEVEYQVDTGKLHWDLKEHGENLNHISEGIASAVEEKLRSERMKTELITNVSHDIKTPLTSIINYADLIGKEPSENKKITEYAEVLVRQSDRLKRLIEDLVEASKASTGNLDVELMPCEASVFITQIAGEFKEKLDAAGLQLITKGADSPVKIMADGRRMLRIFDNLMNNICKYAKEDSRVYLSLEQVQNHAVIMFKNMSRMELDLSPEELMERFVRGDQSRTTEGNGLGLSIAKSLTELQGGTLSLFIDGDLFKVVLEFPVLERVYQ